MDDFGMLIEIIEASVAKHGPDKPLTLGHLLNLLKQVEGEYDKDFEREDDTLLDEFGDR